MQFLYAPLLVLFFVSTVTAWIPSCAWTGCLTSSNTFGCVAGSGFNCLCKNAAAIAQINTCVATSCTNVIDQEAIYGAIAQLCANNGVQVTNSQQATFSATAGGSLLPAVTAGPGWGPGGRWAGGDWSSWVSAFSSAMGTVPQGWNGGPPGGPFTGGPWASGSGPWNGPWATKAGGVACSQWTTWSAGWGPYSAWTGTWSGCVIATATATPLPATITRTITTGGTVVVVTDTTLGVQAQAVQTISTANDAAAIEVMAFGIAGGAAAAILGFIIAL